MHQTLFADVIIHNWASPKAVEFAGNYNYKLIDIFVKPKEIFASILDDVQASLATETDAVITGVKTALDEMREE